VYVVFFFYDPTNAIFRIVTARSRLLQTVYISSDTSHLVLCCRLLLHWCQIQLWLIMLIPHVLQPQHNDCLTHLPYLNTLTWTSLVQI
jgi:hypothetical protein